MSLKQKDSDIVLMHNSMFIRKISNRNLVFFCTEELLKFKSTTKCSWSQRSKESLQECFTATLTARFHLQTIIHEPISVFFTCEVGKAAILDQSQLVVIWDPRKQLNHTNTHSEYVQPKKQTDQIQQRDSVHRHF